MFSIPDYGGNLQIHSEFHLESRSNNSRVGELSKLGHRQDSEQIDLVHEKTVCDF